MTATIVPEFILNVLENELSAVSLKIVRFVCDQYKLPFEEVKEKLKKHINIELDIDTETSYKIHKTHVKKIKATVENQCTANIFCKDQRGVRQCTFQRLDGCKLCKKHLKLFHEGDLKYGMVEDDQLPVDPKPLVPRAVSSKTSTS